MTQLNLLLAALMAMDADFFKALHPGEFENFLLRTGALLMIGVLVLTFWMLFRNVFGRRPPIDEDLARYGAAVEKLKHDLSGLTPNEKFDKLVEQLGKFATVKHIAAMEVSLENQIKEGRTYAHNEVHALQTVVNAEVVFAKDRIERLAALEADSRTHTRQLSEINAMVHQIGKDVNDRVNAVLAAVSEVRGQLQKGRRGE